MAIAQAVYRGGDFIRHIGLKRKGCLADSRPNPSTIPSTPALAFMTVGFIGDLSDGRMAACRDNADISSSPKTDDQGGGPSSRFANALAKRIVGKLHPARPMAFRRRLPLASRRCKRGNDCIWRSRPLAEHNASARRSQGTVDVESGPAFGKPVWG